MSRIGFITDPSLLSEIPTLQGEETEFMPYIQASSSFSDSTPNKDGLTQVKEFAEKYWVHIAIAIGVLTVATVIAVVLNKSKSKSSSDSPAAPKNTSSSPPETPKTPETPETPAPTQPKPPTTTEKTIAGMYVQPLPVGIDDLHGQITGFIELNTTNNKIQPEYGQWIWNTILKYTRCTAITWSESGAQPPKELLDATNAVNAVKYGGNGASFSAWSDTIKNGWTSLRIPVCIV